MHIEPGIVDGAKMALAYGTAAGAAGYSLKLAADDLKTNSGASFAVRSLAATIGVFVFFEILPHFPVGVSEVHFILGTTLFLLLGAAPAAVGLAAALALQGLFFAPTDLPMYFVNLTTLLVPLFALHAIAGKIVPRATAYVDLDYAQVLKMSAVYQGGIIAWVAFWVIYGQGAGVETMASLGTFALAYSLVLLIEPLADLGALAAAKAARGKPLKGLFSKRLFASA